MYVFWNQISLKSFKNYDFGINFVKIRNYFVKLGEKCIFRCVPQKIAISRNLTEQSQNNFGDMLPRQCIFQLDKLKYTFPNKKSHCRNTLIIEKLCKI